MMHARNVSHGNNLADTRRVTSTTARTAANTQRRACLGMAAFSRAIRRQPVNGPAFRLLSAAILASLCSFPVGCSTKPAPTAPATLTPIAQSSNKQWTGVAVSSTGRVFVNSPHSHPDHTWSVAELKPDGSLTPFPDANTNLPFTTTNPINHWVCVQSVHVDAKDRLWVLDTGNPLLYGVIPSGAKLWATDLRDPKADGFIFIFPPDIAKPNSYLNDVRVDVTLDIAYITDSGIGGLIVLDLKTDKAIRRLDGHPSVLAEAITPIIDGREVRHTSGPMKGQPPRIHSDGIALSPDRNYLYWQALTGRTLYRIKTSILRDAALSDSAVAAAVENLGPTVMTDGIEFDANGNLYFSALEKNAIVVRTPDGTLSTHIQDPRLSWPDSFALGPKNTMYVTTAQIHRTSWFAPDGSMPTTPYQLFSFPRIK